MPDLSIDIGGAHFKNPIFVASGTFGYGIELKNEIPVEKLGAIVTKGITSTPRTGYPPPRICETPSGLLNSIGLENVGVNRFKREILPELKDIGVPIVVNVAGSSIPDYVNVVESLEKEEGICAYEINVSCPNIEEGGIQFGSDLNLLKKLMTSLKNVSKRPLWVKITPNFVDILSVAKLLEELGVDAITASNTFIATAVDVNKMKFRLSTRLGGLSGPAIHPIALYIVGLLSKNTSIPIIASGGAYDLNSTLDFILLGAHAVEIGTASFTNPMISIEILESLREFLKNRRIGSIQEIRGILSVV